MKKTKIIPLIMILILCVLIMAGCNTTSETKTPKVVELKNLKIQYPNYEAAHSRKSYLGIEDYYCVIDNQNIHAEYEEWKESINADYFLGKNIATIKTDGYYIQKLNLRVDCDLPYKTDLKDNQIIYKNPLNKEIKEIVLNIKILGDEKIIYETKYNAVVTDSSSTLPKMLTKSFSKYDFILNEKYINVKIKANIDSLIIGENNEIMQNIKILDELNDWIIITEDFYGYKI